MSDFSGEMDGLTSEVIGAAIEVHKVLGPGFREKVYGRALAAEFGIRDIPFERHYQYSVVYKEREVGRGEMDFLVDDTLVVELKAVRELVSEHRAQTISYLKASGNRLGLLLNFNRSKMSDGITRVVYSEDET
ncbi:MAG: GxxExxY protein [Bradymonadaceae bacterium]